mgnify:CR=1 FL=1
MAPTEQTIYGGPPYFEKKPESSNIRKMRKLVNQLILPSVRRKFGIKQEQVPGLANMVEMAAEEERKSRES